MKDLVLTIPGVNNSPMPIPNPAGVQAYSISDLLSFGVNAAIVFAILLSLFFLISGGFDLITASGEKQRIQNSKQKLTFAVIGLIVVLLSLLIVSIIGELFGVKLFNTP